jgi:hypothetical protein
VGPYLSKTDVEVAYEKKFKAIQRLCCARKAGDSEIVLNANNRSRSRSFALNSSHNYTQLLRPLGQALESLQMQSFSLRMDGDAVIVCGRKHRDQPVDKLSRRGFWQLLRSSQPAEIEEDETIELRYTPEQLNHMDEEGRSKRGDLSSPNAHSVSQVVRAVGALVDQKQARLLSVRKDEQKIEIEYESPLKGRVTEEFTAATLYEFWVRMYLKRSSRIEETK